MKIYLVGPPEVGDEYVETKAALERQGHDVLCNPEEPGHPDDLRLALAELTVCDAICLMEMWWSDLQATQLQTVAAWLRLKVVDQKGNRIPTYSLRNL